MQSEDEYKNNRLDGTSVTYFENGVKRSVAHFKNGKKNGQAQVFDENGKLVWEMNFKDDIKEENTIKSEEKPISKTQEK